MAEGKSRGAVVVVRPIVLVLIVATVAFFTWRYNHRREGYTGGDVVTTGTVEAVHVQLGFRIAGRIADLPVSEGATVRAGQIVGRLEPADLDLQARAARTALEAAQAARAQARAARDKAARDLRRQRELAGGDATTQQQLEAASTADEIAAAQLQAAEAQVHQAENAVAQTALQRSYAELRAPEPGLVSEKIHQPGEMVLVGTPVVTLAQVDTVKVHAAVDETRVGAVRPGDRVRLRVYTFDREVFEGQVTDIRPSGDFATRKDWGAQRRDIRTFSVTVRVPNPQHLLKDGMTAEVTIQVSPDARRTAGTGP